MNKPLLKSQLEGTIFARKFHQKYRVTEPNQYTGTPCWEWTGGRTYGGYGRSLCLGSRWLAHRLSWCLHKGYLPATLQVNHRCHNRLCVNPEHLYTGTQAQNMEDAVESGRIQHGSKHYDAKLTDEDVLAIRASVGKIKELSAQYGVSYQAISQIRTGRSWRHLLPKEQGVSS